ncbi:MAG: hypothetical protein ACK58L_12920, partial [Planctomycetota bacterium]
LQAREVKSRDLQASEAREADLLRAGALLRPCSGMRQSLWITLWQPLRVLMSRLSQLLWHQRVRQWSMRRCSPGSSPGKG